MAELRRAARMWEDAPPERKTNAAVATPGAAARVGCHGTAEAADGNQCGRTDGPPDRFTLEVGLLLKRVEELRPDLIVLDYIIGREDLGWQFLQLLKLDRATRDVPVIICTGAVRQVQEMEAQLDKMGVAVVLKPFDIDHLIGVINKVLAAAAEQADPA
jgi:CheY-like chemotaxis protein